MQQVTGQNIMKNMRMELALLLFQSTTAPTHWELKQGYEKDGSFYDECFTFISYTLIYAKANKHIHLYMRNNVSANG